MKKFRFSLQALQHLRETQREQRERDLGSAVAVVTEAAAQLEAVVQLHQTARATYVRQLLAGALAPHEAALHINYIAALAARELTAQAHLAACEGAREAARQTLAEAARQHEVIANLHARERQRHTLEVARVEQLNLDEMASLANARRRAETNP